MRILRNLQIKMWSRKRGRKIELGSEEIELGKSEIKYWENYKYAYCLIAKIIVWMHLKEFAYDFELKS